MLQIRSRTRLSRCLGGRGSPASRMCWEP